MFEGLSGHMDKFPLLLDRIRKFLGLKFKCGNRVFEFSTLLEETQNNPKNCEWAKRTG